MTEMRRYTFKLYPNAGQLPVVGRQSVMMAELWNALLQRREDVYRRERRTLSCYDMKKEITELRAACPEWREISVAAARGVAERLDEAFKAFFKRAKAGAGAASGYPRYKRTRDGMSICFAEVMGSGWSLKSAREIAERSAMGRFTACRNGKSSHKQRVLSSLAVEAPSVCGGTDTTGASAGVEAPSVVGQTEQTRSWRFYIKGVPGLIKARGCFPAEPLDYRTGEVIFRDGSWWLSIVVRMAPRRKAGADKVTVTFDLIDEFARVERANGGCPASSQGQITGRTQRDSGAPGAVTLQTSGDDNMPARRGHRASGAVTLQTSGDDNVGLSLAAAAEGAVTLQTSGDDNKPRWMGLGPAGAVTLQTLCERTDAIKSERDRRYRKFSWRWKRETKRAARLTALAARIRKYELHNWSTAIVASAADLTVITPKVKDETASPRGDTKEWGAQIETVSALNRNTLNQAPAMATQMLAYKAAEAGIRCDIVEDVAPKVAVGSDLVTAGKAARRARRKTKED